MAQAIVGSVSKMAVMYTTMLHSPAAAEAPEAAMLRHNDLQYLATHLLVAPFLFDPELKQLLGAGLWFGNEALQLRAAARAAYNDLVGPGAGEGGGIRQSCWPAFVGCVEAP